MQNCIDSNLLADESANKPLLADAKLHQLLAVADVNAVGNTWHFENKLKWKGLEIFKEISATQHHQQTTK